jgi:hypothetical protein
VQARRRMAEVELFRERDEVPKAAGLEIHNRAIVGGGTNGCFT